MPNRRQVAALVLACTTGCAVNLDSVAVVWPESLELAFVLELDDKGRVESVRGRHPDSEGATSFFSLNDPLILGWTFDALREMAPEFDEARVDEAELAFETETCLERGRAIGDKAERWPVPADTQLFELSLSDGSLAPAEPLDLTGLSIRLPIDYAACGGGRRAELRPFVGDGRLASHAASGEPSDTIHFVVRLDDDRVVAVSSGRIRIVDRRVPYRDEAGHRIRVEELGLIGGFRDLAALPTADGHRIFSTVRDIEGELHHRIHVDLTDEGFGEPVLGPEVAGLPHGLQGDDRAAYFVTSEEVWTGTAADSLRLALSLPGRYMREMAVAEQGGAPHVIVGLVGLIVEGDLVEGTMQESTLSQALGFGVTPDLYEVAFNGDELWVGSDNEGLFYRDAEGRWAAAPVEFRQDLSCFTPPDACGRRASQRKIKHVGDGSALHLLMSGSCDVQMYTRWGDDCVVPAAIADTVTSMPLDLSKGYGRDGRVTIPGGNAVLLELVR